MSETARTINDANTAAAKAEADANAAQVTANTALTLGYSLETSTLQRANNLADVPNASLARDNLGVASFPVQFIFDGTIASGLTRYVPLTKAYTVPANFNNTFTWCGVFPTADAVFTVELIRSPFTYPIGTITLIHGGNYNLFSTFTPVSLYVGDVLSLTAPNPADSTLANVGITLALSIT